MIFEIVVRTKYIRTCHPPPYMSFFTRLETIRLLSSRTNLKEKQNVEQQELLLFSNCCLIFLAMKSPMFLENIITSLITLEHTHDPRSRYSALQGQVLFIAKLLPKSVIWVLVDTNFSEKLTHMNSEIKLIL